MGILVISHCQETNKLLFVESKKRIKQQWFFFLSLTHHHIQDSPTETGFTETILTMVNVMDQEEYFVHYKKNIKKIQQKVLFCS